MKLPSMYSNQDVELVLDSLPIPLLTTDAEGLIRQANAAALELFQYQGEELIGQPVELLMPKRYAAGHSKLYQGFVSKSSTRPMGQGRDLMATKKDGTEFAVEVGLTVLPSEPVHYLASVLDISLRKQAEVAAQERQAYLKESLDEAKRTLEVELGERARLEERQRLGRELHDSLSQSLYGIGLGLRTAIAKLDRDINPGEALHYCLDLTESALVEMRALLFKLRPKSLENVPLGDVLNSHSQAVAARTKLAVEFSENGEPNEPLSFDQKYALYRIATEALHNCTKHSMAREVCISLQYEEGRVELKVQDNGSGFAENSPTGHGLTTMRERAEAAGGGLEITSDDGGTLVSAWIPVS